MKTTKNTLKEREILTENFANYLAHNLDYVWKLGKGNNKIYAKNLAESLINGYLELNK